MRFIFIIFFLFLQLTSFSNVKESPLQNGNKTLQYVDATYEDEIRTVILYPNNGEQADLFSSPITSLGKSNLVLEFDDLVELQEQYRVKLIHCNSDWKPSKMNTLDFLYDFNEFNIINYEYSTDTKLKYVHYTFKVPSVKLPGNYLLVAYRGSDDTDIILTKRFMVYSTNVQIELLSNLMGFSSLNRMNQQIDFEINYEQYELINPLENVKIVIRQNQQWHNAITDLKPNLYHDTKLQYRYFNYENNFSAGNEYRFFDMRSLRYPGQRVADVDLTKRPTAVYLMTDQPRIYQAYAQYNDLNGNFFIQNQDTGGSSESDYVNTTFSLASPEAIEGDVFVVGKMNNYEMNNVTQMSYDTKTRSYTNTQLLKQGWYDYKYWVRGKNLNPNYFEGNHFETENEYEILVYYSSPHLRGDLLIAYKKAIMNKRSN